MAPKITPLMLHTYTCLLLCKITQLFSFAFSILWITCCTSFLKSSLSVCLVWASPSTEGLHELINWSFSTHVSYLKIGEATDLKFACFKRLMLRVEECPIKYTDDEYGYVLTPATAWVDRQCSWVNKIILDVNWSTSEWLEVDTATVWMMASTPRDATYSCGIWQTQNWSLVALLHQNGHQLYPIMLFIYKVHMGLQEWCLHSKHHHHH